MAFDGGHSEVTRTFSIIMKDDAGVDERLDMVQQLPDVPIGVQGDGIADFRSCTVPSAVDRLPEHVAVDRRRTVLVSYPPQGELRPLEASLPVRPKSGKSFDSNRRFLGILVTQVAVSSIKNGL